MLCPSDGGIIIKMAIDTQRPVDPKQWTTKDVLKEILSGLPPQVRNMLQEYMREILAGLVIVILAASLWYGYSAYTTRQDDQAAANLGLAMQQRDPARRIAVLKGVVQQHSQTPAGRQALLLLGATQRDSGQIKAAEKDFDKARQSLPKGSFLYYSALMGLGYLQENNAKLDKAIEAYKSSSEAESGFEAVAAIDLARVSSAMGHKKEALEAYNRYLSLKPRSWQADFVRDQITKLSPRNKVLKKGHTLKGKAGK